ncbi:pyroglutamyl-peptidase I [Microbacterium sp. NPDC091313]
MTTVLLTGFEPFGGDASNPSGAAVHLVGERWRGPEELVTAVLPVTFAGATERMRRLIAEHRPDVVVATGLAGNRAAITPERVAINLADARIPDNAGVQPVDEPVDAGGAAAHFATLPVKAIAAAVTDAGIAAEVSYSAGTFVCNATMYAAVAAAGGDVRAGFIHVPWADDDAPEGAPSLPLADIVRAIEIAVRVSLDTAVDLVAPGGRVW